MTLPQDAGRRAWLGSATRLVGAALAGAVGAGCGPRDWLPLPTLDDLPPIQLWGAGAQRGHALRAAAGGADATGFDQVRHCDVAIIGAGIAGLAAARALRRRGIDDLRVFELEDQAGGNARGGALGGIACPMGAHYLPVPQAPADEVIEWLHEIQLLRMVNGRSQADERHLCHSPQERLWLQGPWVEGLLPPAEAGSARFDQYRRFEAEVERARRHIGFALPSRRAPWGPDHAALDGQTFAAWLDARGLTDPGLRWYLDYACRDDYGGHAGSVSAWAGLHYFASRHGFQAPGSEADAREGLFTWPEGNAWLVRRLAQPLGDRLQTGALVARVRVERHAAVLDVIDTAAAASTPGQAPPPRTRWLARQVVLAVPLHVAARIVQPAPAALLDAAAKVQHAPWLVANLLLREPLLDKAGAAPAWDNVLLPPGLDLQADVAPDQAHAASAGTVTRPEPGVAPGSALGYVDASHQGLRRPPAHAPTVITAYWALGDGGPAERRARRQSLLGPDLRPWALAVLRDLARAHPDLPTKVQTLALTTHGHAMAMPVPGWRGLTALSALLDLTGDARLQFAHSDLAGSSVFEEAFTLGDGAGQRAAARLRGAASRDG